jgi:hypothetical protein
MDVEQIVRDWPKPYAEQFKEAGFPEQLRRLKQLQPESRITEGRVTLGIGEYKKPKQRYSPRLRNDQIHTLYALARLRKRPMTKILQSIVDEYIKAHQKELSE